MFFFTVSFISLLPSQKNQKKIPPNIYANISKTSLVTSFLYNGVRYSQRMPHTNVIISTCNILKIKFLFKKDKTKHRYSQNTIAPKISFK